MISIAAAATKCRLQIAQARCFATGYDRSPAAMPPPPLAAEYLAPLSPAPPVSLLLPILATVVTNKSGEEPSLASSLDALSTARRRPPLLA